MRNAYTAYKPVYDVHLVFLRQKPIVKFEHLKYSEIFPNRSFRHVEKDFLHKGQ